MGPSTGSGRTGFVFAGRCSGLRGLRKMGAIERWEGFPALRPAACMAGYGCDRSFKFVARQGAKRIAGGWPILRHAERDPSTGSGRTELVFPCRTAVIRASPICKSTWSARPELVEGCSSCGGGLGPSTGSGRTGVVFPCRTAVIRAPPICKSTWSVRPELVEGCSSGGGGPGPSTGSGRKGSRAAANELGPSSSWSVKKRIGLRGSTQRSQGQLLFTRCPCPLTSSKNPHTPPPGLGRD